jgi:transcriptional regulator with XRE-family HTH domain
MRLKEWRRRRKLSLRRLGEISGVHFVSLAKMEAGKLDPRLSTLLKLCRALDITIQQLVGSITKGGKSWD